MTAKNNIDNCEFDIHLLELVRLRIAQINKCAYCIELHYTELKNLGEKELRLSSLFVWKDVPYFSNKEKAVLSLTENIANKNIHNISKSILDLLLKYFSEEKIYCLILAIKQIDTWTRLMKTFKGLTIKYQYC